MEVTTKLFDVHNRKQEKNSLLAEIENLLNEKIIIEGLDYNRNNNIPLDEIISLYFRLVWNEMADACNIFDKVIFCFKGLTKIKKK